MAKLLYGTQVTDIIGSIGGLTFQHSKAGKICRVKPVASQLLSEAQIERNVYFAQASAAWTNLSTTYKNNWKTFAAAHNKTNLYGEIKVLTAQNWYMSLYLNAISLGRTPLSNVPTWSLPAAYSDEGEINIDFSLQQMDFYVDTYYSPANCGVLIFASPLTLSPSTADRSNMYFLKNIYQLSSGTYDLYTDYINLWFGGSEPSVSTALKCFIKFGIVAYNRVNMLYSQQTFFISPVLG
jgi:hypothetical protein